MPDFPIAVLELRPGEVLAQDRHRHDAVEVSIVTAGEGVHLLGGQGAAVREGGVLVSYPGQIHSFTACASLGMVNILYDIRKLPFPILDGGQIPSFHRIFPDNLAMATQEAIPGETFHFTSSKNLNRVVTEARMLQETLASSESGNMMICLVELTHILLNILRFTGACPKVSELPSYPLADVLEFVNNNFTKRIPLKRLLEISCLSKRAFINKFRQMTGVTLTEYIFRKRLAFAQKLLAENPRRTVLDIALECGFCDASNFSYRFRRATGMSPTEFRNSLSVTESTEKPLL